MTGKELLNYLQGLSEDELKLNVVLSSCHCDDHKASDYNKPSIRIEEYFGPHIYIP